MRVEVHLLDVGKNEYGDALVCVMDGVSVMIDGAHPGDQDAQAGHESIPDQLATVLEQAGPPYAVDLLVVTHGHNDHIGCLPYLVANDMLRARYALVVDPDLAWGMGGVDAAADGRVRHLVAALREERLYPRASEAAVAKLVADAADLETRYRQMLETLSARGTRVVRHGTDDPAALLREFRAVGLSILGPSIDHLNGCRDIIAGAIDDLLGMTSDLLRTDEAATPVGLYRRLVAGDHGADAVDAAARSGAAVNLQSTVTTFESSGVRILLAGDMQWARPGVSNAAVEQGVRDLRAAAARLGPYAFAKLSHHGSDNGFSEQMLTELGDTEQFGICAGEESASHPNPAVLALLKQNTDRIWWLRTDHNRRSRFSFSDEEIEANWERGNLNDPVPNAVDQPVVAATGATGTAAQGTGVARGPSVAVTGTEVVEVVEVVTRIPHERTRVTVSIEVEPSPDALRTPDRAGTDFAVELAPGRQLPPLLFATNREALARSIGAVEAAAAVEAIRAKAMVLVEDVPSEAGRSAEAVQRVRRELASNPGLQGVVLVGGHSVVPSRIVDCLPAALRQSLGDDAADADNFIVWSDDPYGDSDGDSLAEIPVSRIPDGRSAELVRAALQAGGPGRRIPRRGVRNSLRPFADDVFGLLPGQGSMIVSEPAEFDHPPVFMLDADLVYLMLHGDFDDSSRYWGEGPPGTYPVAVGLLNLPDPSGKIVFAGCCWGALTADKRASRADPVVPVGSKDVAASLALSFLRNGAMAYVGATGSHYSPTVAPFGYAGGPMHRAFWSAVLSGAGPAPALLGAKQEYARGMFHGQTSPVQQAVEYKILREFTCLGLGW